MLSLVLAALLPSPQLDPAPLRDPAREEAPSFELGRVTSAPVAIEYREDRFRLLGSGWEAAFADGRAEVSVTSVDRKEVHTTLALELESIGRGERVDRVPSPIPHAAVEQRVERRVSPGVRELWTAGAAGVELSYVFATPPPGDGDLVVRLAADAGGSKPVSCGGGWLYGDGERALRVGEVLGIDAEGEEVPGEVRAGDGWLELVLPARFVDTAAYPLVLDPPILQNQIPFTSYHDSLPDLVQDPVSGRWAVVYQRRLSSSAYECWASILDSNGFLVEWPIYLGDSASPPSPSVALAGPFAHPGTFEPLKTRFVFGYVDDWTPEPGGFCTVHLRTMLAEDPSTLDMIWSQLYWPPGRLVLDLSADTVHVVVATTADGGQCRAELLQLEWYGTWLSTISSDVLGTNGNLESPMRVAKAPTKTGRQFALVWGEEVSSRSRVRCAIYSVYYENPFVLAPIDLLSEPTVDFREPAVTTDDTGFVVAYIRNDGVDELWADRYYFNGISTTLVGRRHLASVNSLFQIGYPDVAWTGSGYVACWSEAYWGAYIRGIAFDFTSFDPCGHIDTLTSGFVGRARLTGAAEGAHGNQEPFSTRGRIAWSDYGIHTYPMEDCVF